MRVDLMDFTGMKAYEEYDNFTIDGVSNFYKLVSLGTPTGTAG
jgi:Fibrinogen beta and gamma chains, C-terminal globular domain